VSDDQLNEAVVLLDGAIEHANRWPHGVAEEWDVDRFQQLELRWRKPSL
jgi:hypothetical protein